MGLKRKLELEIEDVASSYFRPTKQLRASSFQFPAVQSQDIAMSDVSYAPQSGSPPSSDTDSPSYPSFDLYPFPSYGPGDVDMDGGIQAPSLNTSESRTSSNASVENKPNVGLMQPKASFVHNVTNCYQIPRLRVACESGINGTRTLWTQCDQCGAIEMIDT